MDLYVGCIVCLNKSLCVYTFVWILINIFALCYPPTLIRMCNREIFNCSNHFRACILVLLIDEFALDGSQLIGLKCMKKKQVYG